MKGIRIQGGMPLLGKVRIQGSKNAALPILAATLLTNEVSYIQNCPRIADVHRFVHLLRELGCLVHWQEKGIRVQPGEKILVFVNTIAKLRKLRDTLKAEGIEDVACLCSKYRQEAEEFDKLDYIYVVGDVTSFLGAFQLNVKRVKKMSETDVNPSDYLPVSEYNIEEMYQKLLAYIAQMKHPYLKQLAESFFADADFAKRFQFHSAAKSVHHGFVGGLLEHTLHVTQICDFFSKLYPMLNRDLLLTAAMFHDIGKLTELSTFPANDYTDDGQLLGHIMIGAQMVHDLVKEIPDFPEKIENQVIHCILAHHGELEYGSPKKPALAEAVALNLADNTDARMETLTEIFHADKGKKEWLGYNRFFESNLRRTGDI